MAMYLDIDLEYMFDMLEFDGDEYFNDPFEMIDQQPDDFDFEGDDDVGRQRSDTMASEARNGKDMQGIPWERLNFTRDQYREMRLKQYKNYENLFQSRDQLEKECKQVEKGSNFYDFQYNTRHAKSSIVHFQVPGPEVPFDSMTVIVVWFTDIFNLSKS